MCARCDLHYLDALSGACILSLCALSCALDVVYAIFMRSQPCVCGSSMLSLCALGCTPMPDRRIKNQEDKKNPGSKNPGNKHPRMFSHARVGHPDSGTHLSVQSPFSGGFKT